MEFHCDPALSLQWIGSLLWCGFCLWPGNFHMPQPKPKPKKKKKHATCHHANSFFPFSQFVFLSVIYGSLASESESPRCMFKMHVLCHSHSFQLLNQNLLGVGLENNIFHAIALNTKYVHLCKVSTTVPVTY